MERVKRGFRLARNSVRVLRSDPELLLLVAAGMAAFVVVTGLLVRWWYGASDLKEYSELGIWRLLPAYAIAGLVPMYTNAAVVAAAMMRLEGQDPTLRDGLRVATRRLPRLLAWAAIATVVGMVIQLIIERLNLAGRLIGVTLGLSWQLATMFVIPIILVEDRNLPDAVRRSAKLFKDRWGEATTGVGSIGLAMAIVLVPLLAILPIVLILTGMPPEVFLAVYMSLLAVIVVATISLSTVFNAALYRFATTGDAPGPYGDEDLGGAFVAKERKGLIQRLRRRSES